MTTDWKVDDVDATLGATVTGLHLADLDDDAFTGLYDLWLRYALLIFPDQHLTNDQQNTFARRFGDLEFETAAISNVRRDGSLRPDDGTDDMMKVLHGNMEWHPDSTYLPVQAKGAVFSAEVVPSTGGATGFADMRAAYDALDEPTRRRVDRLSAFHSLYRSQPDVGDHDGRGSGYSGYGFFGQDPQLRPLVKVHPETGRRSLLIGRHAYGVPGLEPDESERLLADLVDAACRPPRTYIHTWTPGEVVVWDNRCLLHRALTWDMKLPRVMHHTRIAGDPVTEQSKPVTQPSKPVTQPSKEVPA
jgi:alpha-ketoglutarate-dependent taurine dioxygenase